MYTPAEMKAARLPHELFLFNMVGNHILLNVIVLSNINVKPMLGLIVPVISLLIISFLLLKGPAHLRSDSLFVRYHWHLVIKRTRIFLIGYVLLAIAFLLAWFMYAYVGAMKELVIAVLAGLGLLPVMALVIVLTVMDSESLSQAIHGREPTKVPEKLLQGTAR
ncbi:MAG: hypothetical protein A2V90_09275 [Gammaproteobacteria bacterium RBG_16_57_12]|nr:MAG: hypothetical protein A2V90_09275 [Gammaproteobacteria bacterium RBG_16_57_12]